MMNTSSEVGLAEISAILDRIPEPVIVIDPEDRIVMANSASSDWYGSELKGYSLYAVFRQPEALECIRLARSMKAEFKTKIFMADVEVNRSFELCAGAISASGPRQNSVVVSLRDVSKFEELDQLRREFVANVSHELRSPLTCFSGIIETLQGNSWKDEETRDKFLGLMETETRRMTRLVSDLLSLSRVETEERIRPTEEVDMVATVRDSIESMAPLARTLETRINFSTTNECILVPGDRSQLAQVANNLIENALKYGGRDSEISMNCRVLDSVSGFDGKVAEFEVQDRGEGIEDHHIPRLTERFYRVDKNRSRSVEGTGLGLAIVKHIVNRHRGRMVITSEVGSGSQFAVRLPALDEAPAGA